MDGWVVKHTEMRGVEILWRELFFEWLTLCLSELCGWCTLLYLHRTLPETTRIALRLLTMVVHANLYYVSASGGLWRCTGHRVTLWVQVGVVNIFVWTCTRHFSAVEWKLYPWVNSMALPWDVSKNRDSLICCSACRVTHPMLFPRIDRKDCTWGSICK